MTQGERLTALILSTPPEQRDNALRRCLQIVGQIYELMAATCGAAFSCVMPPITARGGGQMLALLDQARCNRKTAFADVVFDVATLAMRCMPHCH